MGRELDQCVGLGESRRPLSLVFKQGGSFVEGQSYDPKPLELATTG